MPTPTDIKLRTASRLLEVQFDDGTRYQLPFERSEERRVGKECVP